MRMVVASYDDGVSPSGKAAAFGAAIRRFESYYPSHFLVSCAVTIPWNTGLSVNTGVFCFKREF